MIRNDQKLEQTRSDMIKQDQTCFENTYLDIILIIRVQTCSEMFNLVMILKHGYFKNNLDFYPRVHICVPPGKQFALLLLVVLGWRPFIKLGNISADS
jgi:hypothetical protein